MLKRRTNRNRLSPEQPDTKKQHCSNHTLNNGVIAEASAQFPDQLWNILKVPTPPSSPSPIPSLSSTSSAEEEELRKQLADAQTQLETAQKQFTENQQLHNAAITRMQSHLKKEQDRHQQEFDVLKQQHQKEITTLNQDCQKKLYAQYQEWTKYCLLRLEGYKEFRDREEQQRVQSQPAAQTDQTVLSSSRDNNDDLRSFTPTSFLTQYPSTSSPRNSPTPLSPTSFPHSSPRVLSPIPSPRNSPVPLSPTKIFVDFLRLTNTQSSSSSPHIS